ncbi:MAG: hypothetical protein JOY83_00935 [Alphaproteobacteria bacterium]|nr:hypothetical protein [Alphaproteobacteria bacterium]
MTRLISTLFAALFVLTTINNPALAVTINGITATGQFLFVDNISINDVGVSTGGGGLEFKFGAQIAGGSLGYSLGGEFTPTGATSPTLVQNLTPCGPTTTSPDFCGGAVA